MKNFETQIAGALVGPTGVGKTAAAIDWAERDSLEIVSVDSRQVYRDFKIGTAQPSSEEQQRCKHHFVNFLGPDEKFSVGSFLKDLSELCNKNPSARFLLVGGTGFYIKALQDGLSEEAQITPAAKAEFESLLAAKGLDLLQQELQQIDPIAFARMERNDRYRVQKAWEVYLSTGRPWSSFLQNKVIQGISFPCYFADRPREELYERINQRTLQMLNTGWVEEVETLLKQGISPESAAMQTLGYPEIQKLLQGEIDRVQCVEQIAKQTRNYAKRQLTFFRNQIDTLPFELV